MVTKSKLNPSGIHKAWQSLGVVAVCLAALVPLCTAPFPATHDGRYHLFRMVELDAAIRQGILWPRFAPDLVYGYGYPIFNYYAPLVYYLGVGLHGLGLNFVPTLAAIWGAAIVLGAAGSYKWTEEFFGPVAGYVAAAAYAFAPYTLLNVLVRGAAPEALAIAWLPWLAWSARRVFARPTAWACIRLSALYAALLVTHNLSALAGTGLLVIVSVIEIVLCTRQAGSRASLTRSGLVALSLGTGLLIAAYFWIPAIFETHYVQFNRLSQGGVLDYRRHFLTLSQLLTLPKTFDPQLAGPAAPLIPALGLPTLCLALAGGLLAFRHSSHSQRWRILGLAALVLGLIGLMLPVSLPLWDHLPFLQLFQFPWRFLGPAAVLIAWLAGAAFAGLANHRWLERGLAVAVVVSITMYGFTWTWGKIGAPTVRPDLQTMFDYERSSGSIGTTAGGEYLPVGVTTLPPTDRLMAAYASGNAAAIDRLDRENLPADVLVQQSQSGPLSLQTTFSAPQPFTATVLWFYFPGWQAELDGQVVAVQASKPYGLITVAMPAGEHTLRVFFGTTPLRQLAGWLSAAGLLGLAALVLWLKHRPFLPPPKSLDSQVKVSAPQGLLLTLALLGIGLGGLRLYLNYRDSPFRYTRFDGQHVAGVSQDLDVNFGDTLNLIGRDSPPTVAADQSLDLTLYWKSYARPSANYSIAAQLVDETGQLFGQQDVYQPGGFPTSEWQPDNYLIDTHLLRAYVGTPPGEYRLVVGVYPEGGSGPALTVYDANHAPSGNTVEVARVTLTAPHRPPTDAELNPQLFRGARLGPLTLVGFDLPTTRAAPGDDLALTLYWRVLTPAPDTRARLRLVDANGQAESLGDFAPVADTLPPSAWKAGAAWRAPHPLLVPPTTSSGPVALRLSLVDGAGQPLGDEVTLATLEVTSPARQFTVPTMATSGNWRFGDAIRLLGYDLPVTHLSPGGALPLTLYWQAEAVTTHRYVVFVHVLDSDGQIVAQADTPPLQGSRPTTGWLPGEVLTDPYTLTLPANLKAGEYRVEAGLYDAMTLERLAVTGIEKPAGRDWVEVGTIRVELTPDAHLH